MKKNIKYAIVLILFFGCFPLTISADKFDDELENTKISSNFVGQPSTNFIDYYSAVFNDYANVVVMNLEGKNITSQFYKDNIRSFNTKNFNEIYQYVLLNVSDTSINKINKSVIKTRSPFVTCPVSKRYYSVLRKNQASGEIEYYVEGSFIWDRANGRITTVGKPTLRVSHLTFGSRWDTSISNVSTVGYASSGDTVATFNVNFNVNTKYTIFSETFSCSGSVSSTPFG